MTINLFCKFRFYFGNAKSLLTSTRHKFEWLMPGHPNPYNESAAFLSSKDARRVYYFLLHQLRWVKCMRIPLKAFCHGALISAVVLLALPASALEPLSILFVSDHGSYMGNYGLSDKSISVVIDGLPYRGHFSDKKSDVGSPANDGAPLSGSWGRAFLFASSAKVMQCTLDAGFPKVSGLCRDADGRPFTLMSASKL